MNAAVPDAPSTPISLGPAPRIPMAISGTARRVIDPPIDDTTPPTQSFANSGSRQTGPGATSGA